MVTARRGELNATQIWIRGILLSAAPDCARQFLEKFTVFDDLLVDGLAVVIIPDAKTVGFQDESGLVRAVDAMKSRYRGHIGINIVNPDSDRIAREPRRIVLRRTSR